MPDNLAISYLLVSLLVLFEQIQISVRIKEFVNNCINDYLSLVTWIVLLEVSLWCDSFSSL